MRVAVHHIRGSHYLGQHFTYPTPYCSMSRICIFKSCQSLISAHGSSPLLIDFLCVRPLAVAIHGYSAWNLPHGAWSRLVPAFSSLGERGGGWNDGGGRGINFFCQFG